MFAEQVRRALAATPRAELCALAAAVWKGFACGALAEGEAQALAEEIAARKAVPVSSPNPASAKRRVGSRPRSSESVERRRRWVASGWMPPALACRFTPGEAATLSVVASQAARHGRCDLALDHIAALAGVGRSTVKAALRQGRALGVLSVEHRPDRPFRHRPNVVRVVSPEWQSWISMRRSGQGVKSATATRYTSENRGKRDARPERDYHRAGKAVGGRATTGDRNGDGVREERRTHAGTRKHQPAHAHPVGRGRL